MIKMWIGQRENGDLFFIGEYKKSPKNAIAESTIDPITGEYENPAWLQLENIQDPVTGEMIPTITINQVKKDQIQADEKAKKDKDKADKDLSDATKADLLSRLLSFDETKIKDLNDIKSFAKDVKDYFNFIYKDLVDAEKDKNK